MREAGKHPEFRTPGSATTTANMPLQAVGNVPVMGVNPLKYALGEIFIDPENPSLIELLNTGDAAWTASGPGRVELIATSSTGKIKAVSLPTDTPRYGVCRIKLSEIRAILGRAAAVRCRLAVAGRPDNPAGISSLPFGEQITLQAADTR